MVHQDVFMTQLYIRKVRHLKDIKIPISSLEKPEKKHLIITGKNGSGKTSLLDALAQYLSDTCGKEDYINGQKSLRKDQKNLDDLIARQGAADKIADTKKRIKYWEQLIQKNDSGIEVLFNIDTSELNADFKEEEFILAFFKAERTMQAIVPKHVEKVELKTNYTIFDDPGKDFIKYLVDKKVSQSLLQTKGEYEKANRLANWFDEFEKLLQEILEDPELKLDFDVDTFSFHILETGRERFDFNTLSAGYAAILNITVNILMRMERQANGKFSFDMPGIVLIDELETHLHYELQKKVLPFLCRVFPHIQFIISTHSAFIINSIPNAVIFDLENRTLVTDGLADYPYEGIIQGYFEVSTLSNELQEKFNRYRELTSQKTLKAGERTELEKLSLYLDEIPDYLALDITTEYRRLKLEYEKRSSTNGKG